jgi:CPA1 family monovalent cation:H+ antiporter
MDLSVLAEDTVLIRQELGFVTLLAISVLVAIVVRRVRIPYTVALVLVGLILSFFPNFLNFSVSSELILAILVPPLLFEATLHLNWAVLKNDLVSVLLLAIVGTLMGTFIVGAIVVRVLDIPFVAALAFGALISATDPVAVISFFRTLGVTKRLSILVEGESLFNDGVAIVIFNLAISAAALGGGSAAGISLTEAISEFVKVAFGGLGIGLILGFAVAYTILNNVDDHLIEVATTVVLAYGAFVIAEALNLSGILAVVAAGLMVGNVGMQNISPTTQLTLDNFWELLAYTVNSLVFLLLGLEIEIVRFGPDVVPIVVAVVAILLSRAIVIYGLTWIQGRLNAERLIPVSFRHVMYWGGLRGAISMALALTLTGTVFGATVAQDLRVMTFGVVLFTLLVQGTTIGGLIARLGLASAPPHKQELQRRQALLHAKSAGLKELERMHDEGILFRDVSEAMEIVYDTEIAQHKHSLREHLQAYPELEQDMYLQAREDLIRSERKAIGEAARRGIVSDDLQDELTEELDKRLAALQLIRANQRWRVEVVPTATKRDTEA